MTGKVCPLDSLQGREIVNGVQPGQTGGVMEAGWLCGKIDVKNLGL